MAKPKTEELQKHTLNLRAGDMDAIEALFPGRQPTVIIRRLISQFVDRSNKVDERPVSTNINL